MWQEKKKRQILINPAARQKKKNNIVCKRVPRGALFARNKPLETECEFIKGTIIGQTHRIDNETFW
jgi:hypothetical protein